MDIFSIRMPCPRPSSLPRESGLVKDRNRFLLGKRISACAHFGRHASSMVAVPAAPASNFRRPRLRRSPHYGVRSTPSTASIPPNFPSNDVVYIWHNAPFQPRPPVIARYRRLFGQNATKREKTRLAGGEDWIRTRGCVSPDDRALLAHKVRIPPVCGKRRVQTKNRANWTV